MPVDGRLLPGKSFPLNIGKLFGVGQPFFPPSGVKFPVQEKWISFLGDSGDIFLIMFWVLRTLRYRGRSRGQLRKYGKRAPARDSVSGLWSRSKPLDNPMMWSRRSRETELSSRNASIPQTVSVRQSQERRFRFIRPTFRASLLAPKTAGPRIRSPAAVGRASHTASGKNFGSSPF